MIWLFLEAIILFIVELFFLWVILFFVEKKKPFINTKNVLRYNPYTFVRSVLLQSVYDKAHYDPDFFRPTGIIIYEGSQGAGKTISLVHDVLVILNEYPKSFLVDNLGITAEGVTNKIFDLTHWKQLLDITNGIYGIVTVIDETALWFSNKDSKNFDPLCLQLICQNRKNRRVLFGTCQRFYLMAKDIRMQTDEVRSCFTLGGVISGYIRKKPILDQSGEVKSVKFRGIKIFVQSNELRSTYDTYKMIKRVSSSGFNSRDDIKLN